MTEKTEAENREQEGCHCPYCDEEIILASFPFCKKCSVSLRYCVTCQLPVEKEAEVCPRCGGAITRAHK
ncbi:zinc ribbon domain-containing protein [Chloroflexota bacterium]